MHGGFETWDGEKNAGGGRKIEKYVPDIRRSADMWIRYTRLNKYVDKYGNA